MPPLCSLVIPYEHNPACEGNGPSLVLVLVLVLVARLTVVSSGRCCHLQSRNDDIVILSLLLLLLLLLMMILVAASL